MTGRSFLAIIDLAPSEEARSERARLASRATAKGLVEIARWDGFILYTGLQIDRIPCLPDEGLVLGSLFERCGSMQAVSRLDKGRGLAALTTGGRWLIENCWGNYVAVLRDPVSHTTSVIRAPMGDLPCYQVTRADLFIVANDVALALPADFGSPVIDWTAVAAHLLAEHVRPARTCLEGVTELFGGERVTVGPNGCRLETLWSPWTFAGNVSAWNPVSAAERLHETIAASIAALARPYGRILLSLSGGLDSSIVAAALARARADFACLTLVSNDASGDERDYARIVADVVARPLHERHRRTNLVDVLRSEAAGLPRPVARCFSQESDRLHLEVAETVGADAFMSGAGGDSAFGYQQSVTPVIDRLLREKAPLGAWRTASDIGEMVGISAVTMLVKALWRAISRTAAHRLQPDDRLLNPGIVADATARLEHPWLTLREGALPGRAGHVALVAFTQNYLEGFSRAAVAPMITPLLVQPIVEESLLIPSWAWFRHGMNRVVARDAFRKDLPTAIIDRRTKGSPDSFAIELFEANYEIIREMLLDGLLVSHGIVVRDALDALLRQNRVVQGLGFWRLMALVDVEAWLRSW